MRRIIQINPDTASLPPHVIDSFSLSRESADWAAFERLTLGLQNQSCQFLGAFGDY